MGIIGQFLDVIEYVDDGSNGKDLVHKFNRTDNEIKQGSRLIVRNGQAAVFVCKGQIADVMGPGDYRLNTGNFPILSTLAAFPTLFNSPIKSDLYFVNTTQFINMPWETPHPIIKRDSELGIVRITAIGKFSFRVNDPQLFMNEIFGSRSINMTLDIILYLRSFVAEAITQCIGEMSMPVIDLATQYTSLSEEVTRFANNRTQKIGIEVPTAVISAFGLPPEVEKYIDEQAGINLASQNMDDFVQYQAARAIRDAAKQRSGLAGIGASYAVGKKISDTMDRSNSSTRSRTKKQSEEKTTPEKKETKTSLADKLKAYKEMLDMEMITPEEYDELKKKAIKESEL